MVYVALLRGINVGGKNKVAMSQLKHTFEAAGCKNVITYINSGNVIFIDVRTKHQLQVTLEQAIVKDFGFEIRVLVQDLITIKQIINQVPAEWTNDDQQKTDVMFLWDEINAPEILDKIIINPKLEKVLNISGSLIWNIARKDVTRGNGIKLIKTDLYKYMTIRNINSVRKIHGLMEGIHA